MLTALLALALASGVPPSGSARVEERPELAGRLQDRRQRDRARDRRRLYAFALNLDMASAEDTPKRLVIAHSVLRALGILPAR